MTRDLISVAVDMDQEEVSRQVASYNLLAIPVVEKDGKLVGIITVDDVVDVIREEATEDMLKMAGAIEEDAMFKSSSMAAARVRLPWLFTNLVGSLLSGMLLWMFRYTIQEVVAVSERRGGSMPMRELLDCKLQGVRVVDIATHFEKTLGQIRLDAVSAGWLIFGDGFQQGLVRTAVKRLHRQACHR